MNLDLDRIKTEQRNQSTMNIDCLSTIDMVHLINEEDKKVACAVEAELEHIAAAIDLITMKMQQGGRLVYSGCGTSGRLGVLDAVECPPTFSTGYDEVIALIAGGKEAIFRAREGAEDSEELGAKDLQGIHFSSGDVLVGIAASGRTPYVIGAINYAKSLGAPVIGISCSPGCPVEQLSDIAITPVPGPEVVTGSTRMKSGTAQKMILNMLSTGTMIKRGKVYSNLMVDVKPTNEKLIRRCQRIVCEATGVSTESAAEVLEKCGYRAKTAIVMIKTNSTAEEAESLLNKNGGRIAAAAGEV